MGDERRKRKGKVNCTFGAIANSALGKELGIIGERGQLRENREQNESRQIRHTNR